MTILLFLKGKVSPFTGNATIDGTLNIDFTDTLDLVTIDNYESLYGFEYLTALSAYVDLNITGDFIGTLYDGSVDKISVGTVDGQAELVGTGLSFPVVGVGTVIEVGSGNYSGSFIRHTGSITDQTGLGGGLGRVISLRGSFVDGVSGDKTVMGYELGIGTNPYYNVAQKINNAGERVDLKLDENITGFVIDNDLSNDTASVLKVENNNTDTIIDFLNDNVQSDVVLGHDYADDTAAALGGVPIGGFYHASGTLKIRTV